MEEKGPKAVRILRRATTFGAPGSRQRAVLRLFLWTLLVCVSAFLLDYFFSDRICTVPRRARLGLYSFLFTAYCGALMYAVMRFKGGKELRWALISAVFFLFAGESLKDVGCAVGAIRELPPALESHVDIAVSLMVGVLMLAAATERVIGEVRVWRVAEYVIGLGVGVFLIKHYYGSGIVEAIQPLLSTTTSAAMFDGGGLYVLLDLAAMVLIVVSYAAASVGNVKRFLASQDYLAMLMSYWCIPVGLVGAFLCVPYANSGHTSWVGAALSTCGGFLLLAGANLENGRLYTEAQEKMNELEALHVVSWELVGRGTLDGLAEALAGAFIEHMQAHSAAVFLHEPEEDGLRMVAAAGERNTSALNRVYSLAQERRPGFHSGHTAKAFREGNVVVVEGIFSDVEFLQWQVLAKQDGMVVSVPISDTEGTLGVYNLFFASKDKISPDKIRFYKTIAASAGAAIRHMQAKQATAPLDLPQAA